MTIVVAITIQNLCSLDFKPENAPRIKNSNNPNNADTDNDGVVDGDGESRITKLSKIESGDNESLTFLGNPKYTEYIYSSNAAIVIVKQDLVLKEKIKPTLIRVKDPSSAFSKLLSHFNNSNNNKVGIDKKSSLHSSVKYGNNLFFDKFSIAEENVVIGENVKINGLNKEHSGEVNLGFRAEDASIVESGGEIIGATFSFELLGDATMVTIKAGGEVISVKSDKNYHTEIGSTVRAHIPANLCLLFNEETGEMLDN